MKFTLSIGLTAALLAVLPAHAAEPAAPLPAPQATSPFDVVKMPGGVDYRELAVGTGAAAYPGNTVGVQYTGWLRNPDGSRGAVFDSSRNSGQPLEFVMGGGKVIRGWEMGVQGMKVGGTRTLIIPSILGYGDEADGTIPANAGLVFTVQLVSVTAQ